MDRRIENGGFRPTQQTTEQVGVQSARFKCVYYCRH